MDVALLKQFKKGDQVDLGELMPGIESTDVRWTCTNVVDGKREVKGESYRYQATFRMAEFDLDCFGVSLGTVRAYENEQGTISWESVK